MISSMKDMLEILKGFNGIINVTMSSHIEKKKKLYNFSFYLDDMKGDTRTVYHLNQRCNGFSGCMVKLYGYSDIKEIWGCKGQDEEKKIKDVLTNGLKELIEHIRTFKNASILFVGSDPTYTYQNFDFKQETK